MYFGFINIFKLINAFDYAKIYDKSTISEKEKNDSYTLMPIFTSFLNDDKVDETEIKYGKLSGVNLIVKENVEGELDIKVKSKSGKLKILICDNNDKQIYFNAIKYKKLNLPKGEYNIYAVGKWFSGKIIITDNK